MSFQDPTVRASSKKRNEIVKQEIQRIEEDIPGPHNNFSHQLGELDRLLKEDETHQALISSFLNRAPLTLYEKETSSLVVFMRMENCAQIVLRNAFKRLLGQGKRLHTISLLQSRVKNFRTSEKTCVKLGKYLKAHKYQQLGLGTSLAMCGIVSSAAHLAALEAVKASKQAIKVATITSKKMKLKLVLSNIIAAPYTNFAVECDFAKCAKLQAEIHSLSALIDDSEYEDTNSGEEGFESDESW